MVFDFRLFSYCDYPEDCESYIKKLYAYHVEYLDGMHAFLCPLLSYLGTHSSL